MKKIALHGKYGEGKYAVVDDGDYDELSRYNWYMVTGYAARYRPETDNTKPGNIWMHRIIMDTPAGKFTDHINGNRLDNRKDNLRIVTWAENDFNRLRLKSNTSGHRGVALHKQHQREGNPKIWAAYIRKSGKQTFLGCFEKIEDAISVRVKAEIEIYGFIPTAPSFDYGKREAA